jgi:hypothetical protein
VLVTPLGFLIWPSYISSCVGLADWVRISCEVADVGPKISSWALGITINPWAFLGEIRKKPFLPSTMV